MRINFKLILTKRIFINFYNGVKMSDLYNDTMAKAVYIGDMDRVVIMLKKGTTSYDFAMARAAEGRKNEIVQLMLEKGANNYNNAMGNTARGGHKGIRT